MGYSHRNCVVTGCPNIRQRLGKWAATTCELHGCNNGSSMCDCQPLFKLFLFLTERKNPERRLQWTKNISRNSLNRTLWMPNKDSRVWNLHFVDVQPTAENPDPTLQLSHNKKTKMCVCVGARGGGGDKHLLKHTLFIWKFIRGWGIA